MAHENNLQSVPNEIKCMVMENTDITSVRALACTCRHFRDIYKECHGRIIYSITLNAVGEDVLPFAIARYAAIQSDWKAQWPLPNFGELMEEVHRFGRKYLLRTKKELAIHPEDFSFAMASEIISFHSIVEKWSLAYARSSMDSMYKEKKSSAPEPSAGEMIRIQVALYSMEITGELLPFRIRDEDSDDIVWDMLWHYFSPLENTLAWDIDDFLTEKIITDKYLQAFPKTAFGEDLIKTFLTKYGLRGLDRLNHRDSLLLSFLHLEIELVGRPLRSERYCIHDADGCSWLKPVEGDVMVRSYDIDHILAAFPQEDRGPCNNWFFSLAIMSLSELLNETLHNDIVFQISWWDLARIHAVFPSFLPSMEYMQALLEHEEYDASPYTLETDPDFCREIGYY
ncbi:hypothetical protein F4776DRAFT_674384 [Hypoxylon sp. NC0597]|nr:hypothetical protein F4776DRAFT_674384 [Hypoxylon sp. NC0597]